LATMAANAPIEPVTSRTDQEPKTGIKQEARHSPPESPDLRPQEVIAAWPLLPSALREIIAAAVRSVNASGQVSDSAEPSPK